MNPSQFCDELELALESNRKRHGELAAEFYGRERSRETNVAWLFDRCFREMDAVPNFSRTLAQYIGVLDRDLVQMLAKQIWDETRHYHLLAKVLEELLGRPIRAEEVCPTGATLKQNSSMNQFGAEDRVTMFAARGYGAEYLSSAVNWALVKHAEPMVATPYKTIAKDEDFHARIGRVGLERYALTSEDQERAWNAAVKTADLHLQAYESLFLSFS